MGAALILLLVVLLWVAAVAFPADSRDGRDWLARGRASDRSQRLGD